MLNILESGKEEFREKVNKELASTRKNQAGLKNTRTEMKNTVEGMY